MALHNAHDLYERGVVRSGTDIQKFFPTDEGFLAGSGTATPSAEEGYAPGAMFQNTSAGTILRNTGTKASCTFASITGAAGTLDETFDLGKTIDGATSNANAFAVGDGSDKLEIYASGGGVKIETNGTSNLTIAPDGGTTVVTGVLNPSGNFNVNTNKFQVVATSGNVTAAGIVTSTGNLVVGANKLVVTAASGNVATDGVLDINATTGSGIDINAAKFTVAADTGNIATDGTLDINASAGSAIDVNAAKFTVAAATGDTVIAGDLTVSGTATIGIIAMDAIVAATLNADLTLDGNGSGGVNISSTGTGDITLGDDVTVAASKAVVITGVAATDVLTLTDGDAVISDGSLIITDTDAATTLSLTNNTLTSQTLISVTSTSLTTGIALAIVCDALTTGDMLYLDTSEAGMGAGFFINCNDSDTSKFTVGKYGATVVAGTAAGTAAYTATLGDVVVSDGRISAATTANVANALSRNYAGAGTAAVLTVTTTHNSDTQTTLMIDRNANAAGSALVVDSEGTGDTIVVTGLAASASLLKMTAEAVTGTALEIAFAANTTVNVTSIIGDFIGAANTAMLKVQATGAGTLADAAASVVSILSDNTPANTPTTGVLLDINDTAAAAGAGTAYAVMIQSTNNEGLHVNSGLSLFDEQVTFDGGALVNDSKTLTLGHTAGVTVTFDGTADLNIDAGAANDNINFGPTTDTDVVFHGGTAAADMSWIAASDELQFAAAAKLYVPGDGAGKGLRIPSHATASPNTQDGAGNIFLEIDAKKLWAYDGTGWIGVTLA